MTHRSALIAVPALVLSLLLSETALGQSAATAPAANPVLFRNVRIFDGVSGRVSGPSDVLVRGNRIERIAAKQSPETGATLIEGNGRTLMPGLIDVHWHTMLASPSLTVALSADESYLALLAGVEAERTLMRGFTTVRDVGGSSFGLKRAIDERQVPGPRIFPSGAMISVTSGHGDFRSVHDLPRTLGEPGSRLDRDGHTAIADSPDEVRLRTREQLMRGASQIKLTAGGGVTSPNSPLDAITFTEAEVRAAVEAARNWGTYVTVHAYTSEAIRESISAGVLCIEHAMLMDEATAQLMASKGIWLSTQPLPLELGNAFPPGSDERAKFQQVYEGVDNVYKLARKYKLKTAFGTDVLFSSALAAQQGALLASLTRWYSPAEVLVMATGTNGELLRLSGKRSPYKGDIGVVREGALADLLLVDGDPVADIGLVARPAESLVVIMKDGVIYKNSLASRP
ncbi:MAG TPA: amidohydrolase family protein [Burkholderiaceae bacterium]|nr:amidohydrolase family protein [Burkholderiaceae bacterium]